MVRVGGQRGEGKGGECIIHIDDALYSRVLIRYKGGVCKGFDDVPVRVSYDPVGLPCIRRFLDKKEMKGTCSGVVEKRSGDILGSMRIKL